MRTESMEIKPIRTKRDHEAALKQIERLMDAKRNSPEGDVTSGSAAAST